MLKIGINHITKEEFLPPFFAAYYQTMTIETITSGFKATRLVPFNPETVLLELSPPIEATPSPQGSQSSWGPKTLRTLPEIKQQADLVLTENRKRRRLSASLAENLF
jgi:hypothetical protein